MKYGPKQTSKTARPSQHARPSSPSPALSLGSGKAYTSGWGDAQLEQLAGEDGQAATQNPSVWGENVAPRLINATNEAHGVNADLIAHRYRGDLQDLDSRLEILEPVALLAKETALDAQDAHEVTATEKADLANEIKQDGLSLPHWVPLAFLVAGLFWLLFGDLPIVAKSFELFHLSDKPIVPGLHLTDELHLAGLASVSALIILAHVSGHALRDLAHAFNRRRLVPKEERAQLPRPSGFTAATVVVCLGFALLLLQGLSVIRVDYLRSVHQQGNATAFFDLNLGILCAAVALGFFHANPYGRRWADATRNEAKARALQLSTESEYAAIAGEFNGLLDERDAVVAQAGDHVRASEQDTLRQNEIIARRTVLSQPEPTSERLFADSLPKPTHLDDQTLRAILAGVSPEPTFERLDVDALIQRRQEIREGLRSVRQSAKPAPVAEPTEVDNEDQGVDDTEDKEVDLNAAESSSSGSTPPSTGTFIPAPASRPDSGKVSANGSSKP